MGGRAPSLKEVIEDPSIEDPYVICRIVFDAKFIEFCCIEENNFSTLAVLREEVHSRFEGREKAEAAVSAVSETPSLESWRELSNCLAFEFSADEQYKNDLLSEVRNALYTLVNDSLDLLEYIMDIEEE